MAILKSDDPFPEHLNRDEQPRGCCGCVSFVAGISLTVLGLFLAGGQFFTPEVRRCFGREIGPCLWPLQPQQEQPSFPLASGNYFTEGDMYRGSKFVVTNVGKRICVAMTTGVPHPYAGEYEIVVSSVSWQNGKFYLDSVGKPLEQPEDVSSYFRLQDIRGLGDSRLQWKRSRGEAQDKDYLRPCWESNTPYVGRGLPHYAPGKPGAGYAN